LTTTNYALHRIANTANIGFSPYDYSRFKYGDNDIARNFGTDLAEGFIKNILENPNTVLDLTRQIVVISSPYSFIPTATFALKNFFVKTLNRWLAAHGYPTVQETKVHRTITYKDDYGALNAAERMRLIGNDSFHIDTQFVVNKTLIFLDDIKITGSHERMILKMAHEYHLQNEMFMLYFAELTDTNTHPRFENYLNNYYVKTIFEVENIIKNSNFVPNTRVVKYLLHYDFDAFCTFILQQTDDFCNTLYDLALGNGYHAIEAYQKNLNFVKTILHDTSYPVANPAC
jgi:PRTase ComF-like